MGFMFSNVADNNLKNAQPQIRQTVKVVIDDATKQVEEYLLKKKDEFKDEFEKTIKQMNGKKNETIDFDNGDKYCGQLGIGGEVSGYGLMKYADGGKYEGHFKLGLKHGFGTSQFNNGNKYIGNYVLDQEDGLGRYIWADGDDYEGEWKSGSKWTGIETHIKTREKIIYDQGDYEIVDF